ncbi:type II secretion system F family protein [Campylobacter mucosalis]|uniref:Transformation system, type II secretion system membrane protein CtsF n=1 Tax=Campylobacter mucosalis CCUG 21559 TaxID=1032067 RepID=A0A6G5QHS2_9BACT|nr:type II secretion system F family protein [Campylobacter mucosalis]QCD45220.1 transformation system, type II secretion system membrane protein CtsF [Campylobacter mucosalis CCUG 21559]
MSFTQIEHNKNGKRQQIIIKAKNKSEIKTISRSKNYGVLIKVGQKNSIEAGSIFSKIGKNLKDIFFPNKIKTPMLVATIRQLGVMSNAGISIHESIKEVARSSDDKRIKYIFETIAEDLNQGLSLSLSAQAFKTELGDVSLAMIKLGESTGNMGESLQKLANILANVWDNQQKFKRAIRYPGVIVVSIVVAFFIIITQVVPKFKEVFESFNATLPLPTRVLLNTENFLNSYGIFLILFIIFLIFFGKYKYKNDESFKRFFDKYILKVYLIGNIIFYSNISRFSLIFTELIKSGVPVSEALQTATQTISNDELKECLSSVKILVGRGVSLTQSFNETGVFESMLIQMIGAGEQSGNLDTMMQNVTDYFESKFNNIIDNISTYIEPILLTFLGFIIVLLALGIFMPMWDISQAVKT